MILNMVTMETFAIHDDKIYGVEAFPVRHLPVRTGRRLDAGQGALNVPTAFG